METLHSRIQQLGRRYALKGRDAENRLAELRAKHEQLAGTANLHDRLGLERDIEEAAEDVDACLAVAREAAKGFVYLPPSFMKTGRFYNEDDGADRDTYNEAVAARLIIWPTSATGV